MSNFPASRQSPTCGDICPSVWSREGQHWQVLLTEAPDTPVAVHHTPAVTVLILAIVLWEKLYES